jgi:hypothetical protein
MLGTQNEDALKKQDHEKNNSLYSFTHTRN